MKKTHAERFALRLLPEEREMLARTAEREDRSEASVVRRALAAYCLESLQDSSVAQAQG